MLLLVKTQMHKFETLETNVFMGRKVLILFFIALSISSCSDRESLRINRVEHFYVSSSNALSVFQILTDQFGLPVVWDYQRWGSFSSGGITLGNVVIELIENQPEQITYYGIALEPNQSLKSARHFLDSANISHGRIGKASQWSTMSLTNLLPEDINLFLCDYHDREHVALNRNSAVEKLVEAEGGPLGILFLKEIIIGFDGPARYENEFEKIPGIVKEANQFNFSEGPSLKLVKSDTPFFALSIKVQSIAKAKLELDRLELNTRVTNQGIELISAVFSPRITFIE